MAFPALSTGAFGYPVDRAAQVALKTVADRAPGLQHVRTIRFVLYGSKDLQVHEQALREIVGE